MNGKHTIFLVRQDFYVCPFILIDFYDFTSTLIVFQVSGDNVAISARLQTGKKSLFQVIFITIDRNKSRVSATESDLILAIIPPVVDVGIVYGISEAHHVVNLTPSMFAYPAIAAGIVRIDDWR